MGKRNVDGTKIQVLQIENGMSESALILKRIIMKDIIWRL